MQRKLPNLILTLAALILAACATASTATAIPTEIPPPTLTTAPEAVPATITLTDGRGAEVTLQAPAARIISMAPSNTELLFAVGAGAQIVGRDSFSDFPADALNITDIGGGWGELDLETILTLEADLVLSADIIAPEQNQALEDLGLTVFVLPNPVDFDGLYQNMETVAALTGRTAEAAVAIDALKLRVEAALQTVSAAETTPLVFYQLDSTDPAAPWTSGPGTFIDTLITLAGGRNVGSVLDGAWVQISSEALIAQNPDVILMGDAIYSGLTPEDVAARPGWDIIAAVQNGRVFAFDDNLVSRPGPRLVDGLETLARLLHPELFE